MNPMKEFVDNHDKHVDENFDKFIDKHDKNYDSEDEKEKKKNAFRLKIASFGIKLEISRNLHRLVSSAA